MNEMTNSELSIFDIKSMILELITKKNINYLMDNLSVIVKGINNDDEWNGGNKKDDLVITWKSKESRFFWI
jgi:hypothetical protein